jgi:drug/metabolite transporter (DMT)-like permease
VPDRSRKALVYLSMLTMYIVWGTTYLGIKVGLDAQLPPTLFCAVRQFPAAAILFVVALWRGKSLRISARELRITSIVGLCLIAGGQYWTFLAEQSIPSGIAALVVALIPLWVALIESLFPDMRRPGALGWLGLVIGFTGLGILIWPTLSAALHGAGWQELEGAAVMMVGGWLWTTGTIVSKRKPLALDNMVMTAWEMLVAGAFLLVLGTLLGEWPRFQVDAKGFAAIAYLSLAGSALAFTAFTYALANLPASKVMTYAYVNPVIAVFAGAAAGAMGLVPPEPITAQVLVGMVVIVAGVALTTAAPTLPPRRAPVDATHRALAEEPLIEPEPSEV